MPFADCGRDVDGGAGVQAALKSFQELETLRNNLAHSQQIIPESWERIVVFSTRIETLLGDTLPV